MPEPIESSTATVRLRDLHRMLAATDPYTYSQDDRDACPYAKVPAALDYVRLEAGDGVMCATSSNRYVLAHARNRGDVTGNLPLLLLSHKDVRDLLDLLAARIRLDDAPGQCHNPDTTVTVIANAGGISGSTVVAGDGFGFNFQSPADVTDWPTEPFAMMRGYASARTDMVPAMFGVNLGLLAPILAVISDRDVDPEDGSETRTYEPVTITAPLARAADSNPPILVESGGWLSMLVMPYDVRRSERDNPRVPYGLPAPVTAAATS